MLKKTTEKTTLQLIGIWLFLRSLTSLAAAAFSPLRPFTDIERNIALWPPTGNILTWLNRVLVAPWYRWDAEGFTQIVTRGYAAWDGTTSFHPLYPWLSIPLYRLGVDPTLSLLITSTLATLAMLWAFHRLAALDLNPFETETAILCLVTFPISFVFFAPYTESLFLLWTAIALYNMRLNRWFIAALAACLAALTRQQGVFLVLPMAWWAWEASGRSVCGLKKNWRGWLATLAAPAGLLAWGVYRIGYLHEGSIDFHNLQGLIYSILISPSAHKVVEVQVFRWPWEAFSLAISKAIYAPDVDIFVNLVLGIGFILALLAAWPHMKSADRLYSLAITVVSFSLSTGPVHPYISLPRHLLLALPVFVGLGAALRKPWQRRLLFVVQLLGQIFLIYCYVLEGWIT